MSNNNPFTDTITSSVPSEVVEKLYLNDELADFYFILKSSDGQCERVPAHKLLLAGGSKVFRAMFNNLWLEKFEVKIVDASAAEFKEFLQFFYLRRVNLSMENMEKVMNLGNKYDVNGCLNACGKYLMQKIIANNVCWAYELALLFGPEKLKNYCEAVIAFNTKEVLSSPNFVECSRDMLNNIIKLDSLSCSETELFESCMTWVKNISKQESLTREIIDAHLGNAFFGIRYLSMTIEEFADLISSFGSLFSGDDYQEIIRLIVKKESKVNRYDANPRKEFKELPFNESNSYKRLNTKNYLMVPYYIQETESIKISCGEPFVLKSILCTDISEFLDKEYHHLPKDMPTEIEIVKISKEKGCEKEVIHNQKADLLTSVSTNIKLSKSILIMPSFMYEFRFKQNPPKNCCTAVEFKTRIEIQADVYLQFHDGLNADANTARGLVVGLTICRI